MMRVRYRQEVWEKSVGKKNVKGNSMEISTFKLDKRRETKENAGKFQRSDLNDENSTNEFF